jgi:hypothetical protein
MQKIEKLLDKFSFFAEDRFNRKTYRVQGGVFRTNCLDCLDRTNVTMTKISMLILQKQLDYLKQLNGFEVVAKKN